MAKDTIVARQRGAGSLVADFITVFLAVFLAEIASIPLKRYFTPEYEKAFDRFDEYIKKSSKEKKQ